LHYTDRRLALAEVVKGGRTISILYFYSIIFLTERFSLLIFSRATGLEWIQIGSGRDSW